jgi:hypothetical protein
MLPPPSSSWKTAHLEAIDQAHDADRYGHRCHTKEYEQDLAAHEGLEGKGGRRPRAVSVRGVNAPHGMQRIVAGKVGTQPNVPTHVASRTGLQAGSSCCVSWVSA